MQRSKYLAIYLAILAALLSAMVWITGVLVWLFPVAVVAGGVVVCIVLVFILGLMTDDLEEWYDAGS